MLKRLRHEAQILPHLVIVSRRAQPSAGSDSSVVRTVASNSIGGPDAQDDECQRNWQWGRKLLSALCDRFEIREARRDFRVTIYLPYDTRRRQSILNPNRRKMLLINLIRDRGKKPTKRIRINRLQSSSLWSPWGQQQFCKKEQKTHESNLETR